MKRNNEAILCSAGIDSKILVSYLKDNHHSFDKIYFDHGGRYTKYECKYLSSDTIISTALNFKSLEEESAFIPNRNIIMATMLASMGYSKIWIGGSASDRVNDNNRSVFDNLSEYLSTVNGKYIKIDSPFWDVYKEDMIHYYVDNHKPIAELASATFSCFNPLDKMQFIKARNPTSTLIYNTYECLNCAACFRKCAALYCEHLFIPFYNDEIVKKYNDEFKKCLKETTRTISTLSYIKRLCEEI